MTFSEALAEQRWDDHRYYHHNRVNQALHLVSALSFIAAYVLLFVDPFAAVMLAWLVAMPSRQLGHFWFEPHDYDEVNQATHEHKEAIKVGYNLRRKTILLTIWALVPLVLLVEPTLFGMLDRAGGLVCHRAERVAGVAGARLRGGDRPLRAALLPARRPDRARVGGEDPHRPVPRREALSTRAGAGAARRAVGAAASEERGAPTRLIGRQAWSKQPRRQHLEQDLPPDAGVGERRLVPPPAVVLHRPRRVDDTRR